MLLFPPRNAATSTNDRWYKKTPRTCVSSLSHVTGRQLPGPPDLPRREGRHHVSSPAFRSAFRSARFFLPTHHKRALTRRSALWLNSAKGWRSDGGRVRPSCQGGGLLDRDGCRCGRRPVAAEPRGSPPFASPSGSISSWAGAGALPRPGRAPIRAPGVGRRALPRSPPSVGTCGSSWAQGYRDWAARRLCRSPYRRTLRRSPIPACAALRFRAGGLLPLRGPGLREPRGPCRLVPASALVPVTPLQQQLEGAVACRASNGSVRRAGPAGACG